MGRKVTESVSLPWGGSARRSVRIADQFEGAASDLVASLIAEDYDPSAPWEVTVTWEIADGRAVPSGIALRSVRGGPVTAEAWRSVRVAAVIAETRDRLRYAARVNAHRERGRAVGEALATEAGGRRVARDDDRLAKVARVYADARALGRRDPVRAVGEAFGLAADDVRPKGWVRTARRKGLIHNENEEG